MKRLKTQRMAMVLAAFAGVPVVSTSSCASADESDGVFGTPSDAGKDVKVDAAGSGGETGSGGGTGGTGASGGAGGSGGTSAGTCNPQTCPTPASPAVKCCVTQNGPCGVDYQQGAGCQVPSSGDI